MKNNYTNEKYKKTVLSGNLDTDLSFFKEVFKSDAVFRTRRAKIGNSPYYCALLFMDGLSSAEAVASNIMRSLFTARTKEDFLPTAKSLTESIIYSGEISESSSVPDMLRAVMYGDTVIIIEGQTSALLVNTKGFRTRGIAEPPGEKVSQGPREGFDETALLNVALIRRKLLTPDFCCEMLRVGRRSDTLGFVCYLGSLANKKALCELKRRMEKMDIDGVLDTNYIAENIRDFKFSIFKTTGATERPDTVAARLLEGRIALIIDGSPVVLTVPYLFSENFQAEDDYYQNWLLGTTSRILRVLGFIVSALAPGLFVALICHHPALLPTSFALSLVRLRTAIPVSSTAECIILILAFEFLKEAGARTRQNTGQALSIVGGLVVGQAAVEAQIISAPMLIVVALSGICSVMLPRLQAAIFYIRLITVFACAALGLLGLFSAVTAFALYVLRLESFGVSYTVSLSSPYFENIKDTFIRAPWRKMKTRPLFNKNKVRQNYDD